ncbi:hypothetical protein SPRG_20834 [Saprolegnia parasitica CBS 223.65]|uniref:t-SNARE coiled-coil homology domain-containing protein n=1 Tax=Saprolegnia parasitica (strain CBS 223.65) TaxID=695850 RepID=A0A067C212_SAPPC|nr:hypothetical protein SPRG_20834 [Saprolegnia parasitica CBS 223.65]KDO24804.1 hypothetical protein SPRG_20834 [Saprolegnia parasitica CBS 223.65]|eukprot:XP_012204536.1 hypothetical protein SPRG_20834 [Saprolegnia parasitica CBS 223.65]
MTDRTYEFLRLCQGHVPRVEPPKPRKQKPLSAAQQQAQFNAAASDVSKDVNKVSQRLQQLTLLVRQTNMFNDPTNQINELTQLVKQDINIIHAKLDDLHVYQESQRAGYSSDQAAKHSDTIVSQMKTSLVSTTQGFKDILQVRQETLQHQHERKSQYGRSNPSLLGKPLAFPSLPRPDGVDAGESESAPLISAQSQEFVVNEQGYAESRAEAVGHIQSHIVELGEIFQRLAVMISEQGDMVQRIDDNVDETVMNISAGQEQLEKFYNSLSNNRMLTMKISAILLVFVVFFMFFLA